MLKVGGAGLGRGRAAHGEEGDEREAVQRWMAH